jgi:hypothetical protein
MKQKRGSLIVAALRAMAPGKSWRAFAPWNWM